MKLIKEIFVLVFILALIVPLVSAKNVAYIVKNNNMVSQEAVNVLRDMGLNVEIIEDKNIMTKNLRNYDLVFADDGYLSNTRKLPVYNYPLIVMNGFYGHDWGLTDASAISQLASNQPLGVKVTANGIETVYTRATEAIDGDFLYYYYLSDAYKVNGTQSIARTWAGEENRFSDVGDVIGVIPKGTRLLNGKVSGDKICFFGIAKTEFWTNSAKDLFRECVASVVIQCNNDSQCDDGNQYTKDSCSLPGTLNSTCEHTAIKCFNANDCGTDGFVGQNSCLNNNVTRNYTSFSCHNSGQTTSYCSNQTTLKVTDNCGKNYSNYCYAGTCTNIVCFNNSGCGTDSWVAGTESCQGKNVFQDYVSFTCNNASTPQSFCSNNSASRQKTQCSQSCSLGICVNCVIDTDCNDNDPRTEDKCTGQGTVNNTCTNKPIACFNDGECGINSVSDPFCSTNKIISLQNITYKCLNNGTGNAQCQSTNQTINLQTCDKSCFGGQCVNITCMNDAECNDGNPRTQDSCINNGTQASYCRNQEMNCLSDDDCGFTGFMGNEFCSQSGMFKLYQNATCANPGTLESSCSIQRTPRLINDCNDNNNKTLDICETINNTATCVSQQIECSGDSECDDGNILTEDKCINPGMLNSTCQHRVIGCTLDIDCNDNNPLTADKCINNICNHTAITCLINSDCGTPGFVGSPVCQSGNVWQNYVTYTCTNGGTIQSSCSDSTSLIQKFGCDFGCSDGKCINQPIACSSDNDCPGSGFVGNSSCSGNDVIKYYLNNSCKNAGTPQSFCSSSLDLKILNSCNFPDKVCFNGMCGDCSYDFQCGTGYSCQSGNCVNRSTITCFTDGECNDHNSRTEDKCLNPGTTSSSCVHNTIECFNAGECGTNGFTGSPICYVSDLYQIYVSYSCANAGTSQSMCSATPELRLTQSCQYGCNNGACFNQPIICNNNLDCDDGNLRTVDICLSPGTQNSRCIYDEVKCLSDSDCNDFNYRTEDFCENPGLATSRCNYYSIKCFSDSECGIDSFFGSTICQNNNVYQDYKSYKCISPGSILSVCDINIASLLKETCSCGCASGLCLTPPQNCSCST